MFNVSIFARIGVASALAVVPFSVCAQSKPDPPQAVGVVSSVAANPTPPQGRVLGDEERKALLSKTRKAYYNLRAHGVQEFRFDIQPDWDAFYASVSADQAGREQLLPILKKLRMQAVVGPTGGVTISRELDVAPPSDMIAGRERQVIGGIEQTLTGFFQTWSMEMVVPLPTAEADYQIEELGQSYRLTYKDQSADVTTTLNHDLAIMKIEVVSSDMNAAVSPTLTEGEDGFVLTGYTGVYNGANLAVTMVSSKIDGVLLPTSVKVTVESNDLHIVFPFTFSNFVVKKL